MNYPILSAVFPLSKYKLLVCCLLVMMSWASCKKNTVNYTIDDDTMVKLLTDLHISEAASQQFDVTLRDSFREVFYEQIFEIQQVDKTVFEQEMKELKRDAERLDKIYEKVIMELEKKKEETEKK